jgi:predicted benzoate:H+ symporter BenE
MRTLPWTLPGATRPRANGPTAAAGFAATTIYVSSAVPLYIGGLEAFGDDRSALVGGFAVAFATAGVATALLSWRYRMPLGIGWSLPGLLYLAAAAPDYSLAEITGANLVAAAILVVLALSGLSEQITRALPGPVVLATLAGSSLALLWRPFNAVEADPVLVAAPVAGYLIARAAGRSWFPPLLSASPSSSSEAGSTAAALPPHRHRSNPSASRSTRAPSSPSPSRSWPSSSSATPKASPSSNAPATGRPRAPSPP